MDTFFQQVVNGVTTGSLYALIALGYSMVYGVLKLLNFAHGDLYMIGAFVGYFMIQWFGGPAALVIPVPLPVAADVPRAPVLGVGALGVAIERFAYRPLRDAPRIAPLITALGVSFFLENAVLLLFGAAVRGSTTRRLHLVHDRDRRRRRCTSTSCGSWSSSLSVVLMVALIACLTRTSSASRCAPWRPTARPPRCSASTSTA